MRFLKISFTFFLLFVVLFQFFAPSAFGQERSAFVTVVNPVRGYDFWNQPFSPLETVKGEYEALRSRNFPTTWLLRYDVISNPELSSFFKAIPKNQELGIFFEITPTLTRNAQVKYNQSDVWHKAKSVFLTGYTQDDRKKLITRAFEDFRSTFGYYPKSVGAWWIDAASLSFMKEKYGVTASLVVADQFSTDDYQVWGLYFSSPYYPSKLNALVPAQSKDSKIGVVAIQWAIRDPFNAYGPGVQESTYSVQSNDYLQFHDLDTSYFENLADIYLSPPSFSRFGQLTIGLENSFSWENFGAEYEKQLDISEKKAKLVTMEEFSRWYTLTFPDVSPAHLISASDPLGTEGRVVWFMSPYFRAGWFYHPELFGSSIRDLRLYNDSLPEPCYQTFCSTLDLGLSVSKPLDEATYGDRWTIDEGKISDFKLEEQKDSVKISYQNQAQKPRIIKFKNRDLFIDGEGVAVSEAILRVLNLAQGEEGKISLSLAQQSLNKNWLVFIFHAFLFLLFSLGAFLLPGYFIVRKLHLSPPEKFIIGGVCGIALFALLSFVLGYLRIQFLAIPILFILSLFSLRHLFEKKPKFFLSRAKVILGVLIFAGILGQGVVVFKSGLPNPAGLGFWGPNGHDAIWHLSIISELKNNFPPENPALSGIPLKNYHYFSDLVIAQTAKFTQIPAVDLLFRFFPVLISTLFGLSVFAFARRVTNSEEAGLLATFLSYFGGSFGWIVTLAREGKIGGESMFWAAQSVSVLLNPPFAFSAVLLFSSLTLLWLFLKFRNVLYVLPLSILFGTLFQFKAYGGVLVIASLGVLFLYEVLVKKDVSLLKLILPTGLIFSVTFLPIYKSTTALFVFSPLWFVHTMADYQDRLNWTRLSNARTAYIQMGWWWKLILAEGLGFLIFFIGNLGSRILFLGSILKWFKAKNKIRPFWLFLVVFSVLAIILPLLFIQNGTAWNTIQFFYYFLPIAGIGTAFGLWSFIKNLPRVAKVIVIFIIVIITIPTTISTAYYHYIPERPPARLPFGESQALDFLKNQPRGTVLTRPFDEELREKFDLPLPLFVYQTSAYVSAFSEKPSFVEDEINQEIIGEEYEDRVVGAKEFFRTRDENFQKEFLRKNKIKYVYATKFERFEPSEQALEIKKLFENDEVKIYEVL